MNGCNTDATSITSGVTNRGNNQPVESVFGTFQSPPGNTFTVIFVFAASLLFCVCVFEVSFLNAAHALLN